MENHSTMKVTQSPNSLEQVLGNFNFEVPLYQREYSWELEQVSDLFYDIDNAQEDEGYFLGSILLYVKDETKKLMEVIDGQQRLTTIFLSTKVATATKTIRYRSGKVPCPALT